MPEFILLDEPFSGIDPLRSTTFSRSSWISARRDSAFCSRTTTYGTLWRSRIGLSDPPGQIVVRDLPGVAESEVARKFYLGERFSGDGQGWRFDEDFCDSCPCIPLESLNKTFAFGTLKNAADL
jgi:hypothetical protein